LKRLTHKPKLVAVAGLSGGEGASTLASGLAAALSETGDGKVLLVEMNGERAEMHHFFEGTSVGALTEMLEGREEISSSSENLFLASASKTNGGSSALGAKRFYSLIPNLRASAFDYVIFDMPPVSQSASTVAISRVMDKMILVVEAGISNRNQLKRAFAELVAAGADVSAVFNKMPTGLPKVLNGC
jgi:Mrp family chromosome partitioning ATPase